MLSVFFPLQNAVCFVILTYFCSYIIHILYTGCGKIKKNNSGAKRLKSDKKMGTFRKDRYIFMTTPRSFLFRTRNVSGKGVERIITHILR